MLWLMLLFVEEVGGDGGGYDGILVEEIEVLMEVEEGERGDILWVREREEDGVADLAVGGRE